MGCRITLHLKPPQGKESGSTFSREAEFHVFKAWEESRSSDIWTESWLTLSSAAVFSTCCLVARSWIVTIYWLSAAFSRPLILPLRCFKSVTSKASARHLPSTWLLARSQFSHLLNGEKNMAQPTGREQLGYLFLLCPVSSQATELWAAKSLAKTWFWDPSLKVFIMLVEISLRWAICDIFKVSSINIVRMVECIPECSSEVTTTIIQGWIWIQGHSWWKVKCVLNTCRNT